MTDYHTICVRILPEHRKWLDSKAIEQTRQLGKEVNITMVIRALIQKQLDHDEEMEKVWDV